MFNILNGYAVVVYLSRARLEMHGMKENIVQTAVFRIRIQLVSGFNQGNWIRIQNPDPDGQR
jgi:hypothetical protein